MDLFRLVVLLAGTAGFLSSVSFFTFDVSLSGAFSIDSQSEVDDFLFSSTAVGFLPFSSFVLTAGFVSL